jgi:heme A synthase
VELRARGAVIDLSPVGDGTRSAYPEGMWRHTTSIVALFVVIALGFGAALIAGSTLIGVAVLLGGLVVAFVLAIAWMRPPSSPTEHHPPMDKIFNDEHP